MSRVIVDGTELDMPQGTGSLIATTYKVQPFDSIGTFTSAQTLQILFPATKTNAAVFGDVNVLQATGRSAHKILTNATLMDDSGNIELQGVIVVEKFSGAGYACRISGGVASWATQLDGHKLRDLKTLGSETFNESNVRASWLEDGSTRTTIYPAINYGEFTDRTSTYNVTVNKFRPGVFVMPVFRHMFDAIGWKVAFEGRLASIAPTLVLPFSVSDLSMSDEEMLGHMAEATSRDEYTIASGGNVVFDGEVSDAGNNFASNTYTAPYTGMYSVEISETEYTIVGTGAATLVERKVEVNGSTIALLHYHTNGFVASGASYNVTIPGGIRNDLPLTAGDEVTVTWTYNSGVAGPPGVQTNVMNVIFKPVFINFQDGMQFDVASTLPDMSQKDLLKAILNTFNIIPDTDELGKVVTFRLSDDYYLPSTASVDLELDLSQGMTLKKPSMKGRNLLFKYTRDPLDDLFKDFQLRGTDYADGNYRLDDQYLNGDTDLIKLPFAATYMERVFDGACFVPSMTSNQGTYQNPTFGYKPRLLVWAGMRAGNWRFATVDETEYPFAYFINDEATAQDVALCFNNNNELGGINQGLIDQFYKRSLLRINQGFEIEAAVVLTAHQRAQLSFREPQRFHDTNGQLVLAYLSELEQYRSGGNTPTLIRLIQLIHG